MNGEPKRQLAKRLADDLRWILAEKDTDVSVKRCEDRILQTIEQVERETRRTLSAELRAKVYAFLESEQADPGKREEREDDYPSVDVTADAPGGLKKITQQAARQVERKIILEALEANTWHRHVAARSLGISYRALLYKMREMGLPQKKSARAPGLSRFVPPAGHDRSGGAPNNSAFPDDSHSSAASLKPGS
jgi:hypothetical protein